MVPFSSLGSYTALQLPSSSSPPTSYGSVSLRAADRPTDARGGASKLTAFRFYILLLCTNED